MPMLIVRIDPESRLTSTFSGLELKTLASVLRLRLRKEIL